MLFSILTLVSLSSFAQIGSIAGYIDGEWLDGTVERMPMVKVELIQGGQVVQTVQSDFDGLYRFDVVEPGEYELTFSTIGFENDTIKEVRVQYGRRTVVDVQLEEKEDTVEEIKVEWGTFCIDRDDRMECVNLTKNHSPTEVIYISSNCYHTLKLSTTCKFHLQLYGRGSEEFFGEYNRKHDTVLLVIDSVFVPKVSRNTHEVASELDSARTEEEMSLLREHGNHAYFVESENGIWLMNFGYWGSISARKPLEEHYCEYQLQAEVE